MTTQVTFRMDEELKKRAMAKAKKEGVSLKTIYLYLTQARLDGQMELGMQPVHRELVESPEDRAAWIQ